MSSMLSARVRVLIHDEELRRIREYVENVPHRATGGLLLGHRCVRDEAELIVITRVTTRVPDERLPDETCADHPQVTPEDLARAVEKTDGAAFLGRWHAHLDGLARPSGSDLTWARVRLTEQPAASPFVLHPVVIRQGGTVGFHPFILTQGSGTFQKVSWETGTAAEIERLRRGAKPEDERAPAPDAEMFSLGRTVQRFRDEGARVASLPQVLHTEVRDDGTLAWLDVTIGLGDKQMVIEVAGDPWYPLHPPAVQVSVDGQPRPVASRVLIEWTSMCGLRDLVLDVSDAVVAAEHGETLPPPSTEETDPVKREAAMLRGAGYRVHETSVPGTGTLLTVRSALLDEAGKVYHAMLAPTYPEGKVAWAIDDRDKPLREVSFETLEQRAPDFTLLTWLERLVPAAREARATVTEARQRRPRSLAAFGFYSLLFTISGVAGYWFQVTAPDRLGAGAQRPPAVAATAPAPLASAALSPSPSTAAAAVLLTRERPVLAVVMDAGPKTNLSITDASWAVTTALRPVPVRVVGIDLVDAATDLASVTKEAASTQAVVVFTYGAGERQASFVRSLAQAASLPVGVVSMSAGPSERVLSQSVAFYQASSDAGRAAAQRALFELLRRGAVGVKR